MTEAGQHRSRVRVDGKFFRRGEGKFYPKGVAYGPFAPNGDGEPLPSREQSARDFTLIRELGANLVRVYDVPPRWLLDLAKKHGLLVLVDIPWDKHLCFLDDKLRRDSTREFVRRAVTACAHHPAIFAYSIANEIPTDIVRWSGAAKVADFIDELVLEAKRVDPDCLCTFTNYPPTEFLRPQALDFVCFNVYLHQRQPFKNYLARLQMLADAKPLVLGEFGIDSIREGEARKSEMLRWQIEELFRGGLAGAVLFSFTDDWFKDGRHVPDWGMGLTTADRKPKESFRAVAEMFRAAPRFPLLAAPKPSEGGAQQPKVSVVVAGYNADRTLKACLESLEKLNYPDYEIILVDDGSTDATPQIVANFPRVRFVRHERNRGLSAARNTGIRIAKGAIVAFTDADCRADEDWLYYLVGDLQQSEFAAMGGHNLLPPDDSAVAASVMVSPGGPAHVMLDDRQAEHIPGCNMAFYAWALAEVGGFDPIFAKAGDDVDICWRLQQAGMKIGFSPAAFVWHYRRSNVAAYLEQQRGYGEAEALLVRKHPEYFNSFGDSVWRGRIYTPSKFGVLLRAPIIYRGVFGSAMFQTLYNSQPALTLMLFTTLEYHLLVALPLWVLTASFKYLLPLAIASLLVPLGVCVAAGVQADLRKGKTRWWSRPLVALLFFLQPIVRGWARYAGRLRLRVPLPTARETFDSVSLSDGVFSLNEVQYWSERRVERVEFVSAILEELNRQGWPHRSDIGWSEFDAELYGNRWSNVQLTTVSEDHPGNRQMIRCRLRGRWSLQAKVIFWSLFGLEALVTSYFSNWLNWLGLLLLTLPALAYFLHRQKRKQQSLVVVFLDQLAEKWRMIKITAEIAEKAAAKKAEAAKAQPPADSPFRAPDPQRVEGV
ncbi:MAG: glycosyltransferase [Verrucomicrobia bacterium]|nr:MAG: glycosyltransferase [Verrucomicrobiota bacterium]